MKPEFDSALAAFLQAVRVRLWLQAALRWSWRGLAPTALWLSAAGLIHALAYALPPTFCLATGLIPVGAALLLGLWRGRPSLDRCARTADRWFDGAALLTSAWELYRHPDAASPASRRLIRQQAQQAIPAWRDQLRRRPFPPQPKHAPIAIGLSLIGVFLLTTPGARPEHANQALLGMAPPPVAADYPAFKPRQENPVVVESPALPAGAPVQAEPAALVIPPPAQREPSPATTPSQDPVAGGDNRDDATTTAAADAAGEEPALRAGGASEPDGGRSAPSSNEPDEAAAAAIQWVDWARAPSARSPTAGTTPLEFTAAAAPAQPAATPAGAAQRADARYEASFGPALRPYIARYFELLHDQPDHRSTAPAR